MLMPAVARNARLSLTQCVRWCSADADIVDMAEGAEIGEQAQIDAIALRQQIGRRPPRCRWHRHSRRPRRYWSARGVARADAGEGEAAESIGALKEALIDRHGVPS